MASSTRNRVVRLIAMGGTIAFEATHGGAIPRLYGSDLANWLDSSQITVEPVDVAHMSSIGLTDKHLLQLSQLVRDAQTDGCAGVVITHGTDTLEETAYFLALTCPRKDLAIILTAAMRPNGMAGTDGPTNLRAALGTATSTGAADAGPLVVINDEIHTARFVTKSHATRVSAFSSPLSGPIGQVVEHRPTIWFTPRYTDYLGTPTNAHLPRVDIVKMAIGVDPTHLRAVIDTQPDGLVIEGLGGGHVPPTLLDSIDTAVQQDIPVVIASRCGDGPSLQATYAVPGTEIDLQQRGALMAGSLSAVKVRLRLAVALALGCPLPTAFPTT